MHRVLVGIVIVALLLLPISCTSRNLALTEFDFVCPVGSQGSYGYVVNLENVLNRFSSHVITGTVIHFEEDTVNPYSCHYFFEVDSIIIGELDQEVIVVLGPPGLLEKDLNYMLFLNIYQYNHWQFTAYQVHREFVLLIDVNQNLLRLEDPLDKILVPPFIDSHYNNLTNLSRYIEQNRNETIYNRFNPPTHFIDSVDTAKELLELSELVLKIRVANVRRTNSQTTLCAYEVVEIFKGKEPEEDLLILPGEVSPGQYLVFLVQDSDGMPWLTTRHGSLIPATSEKYNDMVEWLRENN